jgi:hypothetical protein
MKGNGVVVLQLPESEALHDQADFGWSNNADGHPDVKGDQQNT